MLSARGQKATKQSLSYLGLFLEALGKQATAEAPDSGFVICAMAENHCVSKQMASKLSDGVPALEPWTMGYGDMRGHERLRQAYCAMMEATALGERVKLDPDNLTIASGVGSLVEHVTWLAADAGDAVLVPAPYYPAFDNDCTVRADCRVVPVPTDDATYRLSTSALEAAAAKAEAEGNKPRLLILTNPSNPLGLVAPRADMVAAIQWAVKRDMHVLVDEIYCNSVFDPYTADDDFVSAVELCAGIVNPQPTASSSSSDSSRIGDGVAPASSSSSSSSSSDGKADGLLGPQVHVVWGMSKDFGGSGLRIGALYSENASLNAALGNVGYFTSVSMPMQQRAAELLEDLEWVKSYLEAGRASLKASYDTLHRRMVDAGIDIVPACAALFAWLDLRDCLPEPSWEAERALHERLFHEARILLTPGEACHASQPGFFRCCFAFAPREALDLALQRMTAVVERAREEAAAAKREAASSTATESSSLEALREEAARAAREAREAIHRELADHDLDGSEASETGAAAPRSPLDEALAEADRTLTRTRSRKTNNSAIE